MSMWTKKKFIVVLLALGILGAMVGTAFATSNTVGGYLNSDGSLVRFNTWRTHTYTGSITMNLYDITSGYTRLGLRNSSGVQFTDTIQWDWVPQQFNFNWAGQPSNQTFPYGTYFAFNGRMASGYWWPDTYFEGTLWF